MEARSHSPASLPLTHAESPAPWHSESLLVESWSTMGDVDPEDTKSLDSNDGPVLAGDENHSSNSDMVHLEREEAEMLEETEREGEEGEEDEEDEELQANVLSVLGVERELAEPDLQAPETKALLVSEENPHVESKPAEFRHVVPPMALPLLPIVKLDPPSATSTPVPSTAAYEADEHYSTQGLHPPSILSPKAPELPDESPEAKFSQIPLQDDGEHSVKAALKRLEPQPGAPKTKSLSSSELLFGVAALVAVVGVVAYGAIVYCKK
ncbi:bcl-2-like protein 13 [Fundulus heteroclitus]|uniref:bcl-2-like protein 13 n=1 Tax=Fundulus heteroclitus TaxID=8078 RepID=UPI00165B46D0|nr:bcl-2-like protein 13 [Fundulus heteroclitus]